jgi:polysaccharide export outer membrane protein
MLNELQRSIAASYLTKEQQNSLDAQSLDSITKQLRDYEGVGRLVVNLPLAMMGDQGSDLLLEDGDTLHIPSMTNTITVLGEVRRQGSHTFESGLALEDYIDLAAGTTQRADADNIYVVRASGEVSRLETLSWTQFTPAKLDLQPGDSIVVPINTEYKDSLPFWRDITQILYQGTVTIAAVARL